MRILYLHQYFKKPTENGGTRSYDLATSFLKLGYDVNMITTTSEKKSKNSKRWEVEEVDGIIVHYLYLPYENSFSFLKRIMIFLQFMYFSSIKLLQLKGDMVLATSTPLTIGIPAILKKIIHKTPYIFEVRDVWPEAVVAIGAIKNQIALSALKKLEYVIYKNAKFIVPLSIDMKSSILNRYPEFNFKILEVIENIAEVNRFKPVYHENDLKLLSLENLIGFNPLVSILYAGTFGKVNHIEYVIELAKKVLTQDRNIVFLLLGSGSEKELLIKYANDLGVLNKNLFFLRPVNKDELPILYSQITIGSSFVAPIKELWANSANKFFDTLASGHPILINHLGWQAKKISENGIGYVLPPDINEVDVKSFVSYLNNEDELKLSGIRAREIAEKNYSLAVAVQKYNRIFKNCIVNS
ncbi:glycosyltransferase family 4 protein [Sphingobacterium daejeonense]|uniref:Glycosyltransferase family 4 protein n=1 Tax=Sphingobacterium daejeonense TaxID=371142 RepID=A0ABW3RMN5_9SPHI